MATYVAAWETSDRAGTLATVVESENPTAVSGKLSNLDPCSGFILQPVLGVAEAVAFRDSVS